MKMRATAAPASARRETQVVNHLVVRRRSSNSWSTCREACNVRLVTGVIQPVVNVCGLSPEVDRLTFGLPGLLRVWVVKSVELTRMLRITTGRGKVIVPCAAPFATKIFHVVSPAKGGLSTNEVQVQPA